MLNPFRDKEISELKNRIKRLERELDDAQKQIKNFHYKVSFDIYKNKPFKNGELKDIKGEIMNLEEDDEDWVNLKVVNKTDKR